MKYLPWALLVIALFSWHRSAVFMGRAQERIAQLESRKAQVDTVYRTDTLTLTKVRRHTDSLLITDTLIHVDTVRLLVAAERNACNAVIETCERRVAIRDSLIVELKKKPSVLKHLPWVLGGVVAGVVLK